MYQKVLVIGAEVFSRILDFKDRGTCVLFGDGAGAVILDAQKGEGTNSDRGVLCTHLRSDGRHLDKLYVDGGPSTTMTTGHLRMEGKEVFRRAVRIMVDSAEKTMAQAGVSGSEISLVVPHQANVRIIQAACDRLGIPIERTSIVLDRTGNTSAASIPLALADALDKKRITEGDLVLLVGFGGGMTAASALLRWGPIS